MPEVASDAVHVSWTELVPKSGPEVGAVRDAVGAVVSTVTTTESDADDPAKSNAWTRIVCGPSETPVSVVLVALAPSAIGAPPSKLTSMRASPLLSDAVQVTTTLPVDRSPAAGAVR